MAQNTAQDMDAGAYNMTPAQQQMFMNWEDDQRIAYTRWPIEVQEYYWTLSDNQMRGWWVLNDEQRMRIVDMQPQQRAAAWTSIMNQMNGATPMPATPSATTTAPRTANTTVGNIQYRSTAVVQNTPGDQGPPTGDVPICSPNEQDNCINAWEAGKRGPGVTKPLGYWPGQPASNM
ncbi:MAG: hypothetical protein KKD08_03975 [Alphaproteobacteria bacterium]|nr:hypothetical protein [Alphaproteobacteria bacterium]